MKGTPLLSVVSTEYQPDQARIGTPIRLGTGSGIGLVHGREEA
jgi:hypothetical protein